MKHHAEQAILCLVIGLSGCASVSDQRQLLASTPASCSAFADMRFAALAEDGPHDFALDRTSTVFPFASGKSYFAAFSIDAAAPSHLDFRGYVQGKTKWSED